MTALRKSRPAVVLVVTLLLSLVAVAEADELLDTVPASHRDRRGLEVDLSCPPVLPAGARFEGVTSLRNHRHAPGDGHPRRADHARRAASRDRAPSDSDRRRHRRGRRFRRAGTAADPDQAFREAFGLPLDQFAEEWSASLETLHRTTTP